MAEQIVVIPRLDDLQNGFAVDQQDLIIQWFIENGKPLTVGVILGTTGTVSSQFWLLADSTMALIRDSLVEVAGHSTAHEIWANPDNQAADYLQWMIDGHNALASENFSTKVFISPRNHFDSDVYTALKDPKCPYEIISTSYTEINLTNVPPGDGFPVRDGIEDLFWVPVTCSTENFTTLDLWMPPSQAVTGPSPDPRFFSPFRTVSTSYLQ